MDVVPGYVAMFENNDPSHRMIALAKVNYYAYALTH
jgi:hypothetical protein